MQVLNRHQAIWLAGLMLGCYALALVLIGLAYGFDHGWARWLLAAVLMLVAVGMSASLLMRLLILVVDPVSRAGWWTKASPPNRAFVSFSLFIRVATVVLVAYLAVRALGR